MLAALTCWIERSRADSSAECQSSTLTSCPAWLEGEMRSDASTPRPHSLPRSSATVVKLRALLRARNGAGQHRGEGARRVVVAAHSAAACSHQQTRGAAQQGTTAVLA